MQSLHLKRSSKFYAKDLFSMVFDVESYNLFVPYCVSSKVINRSVENDVQRITAELCVGFKQFSHSYTSLVTAQKADNAYVINAQSVSGPFKFLESTWIFRQEEHHTEVDFNIEFESKNTYAIPFKLLINKTLIDKVIKIFEKRAEKLYKSISH